MIVYRDKESQKCARVYVCIWLREEMSILHIITSALCFCVFLWFPPSSSSWSIVLCVLDATRINREAICRCSVCCVGQWMVMDKMRECCLTSAGHRETGFSLPSCLGAGVIRELGAVFVRVVNELRWETHAIGWIWLHNFRGEVT